MAKKNTVRTFLVCIENKGCEDLEKRKIYRGLPDKEAAKDGYLRIIDESGEDYLYPKSYFSPVKFLHKLPPKARKVMQLAS